jgi:hypothetical protein
MKGDQKPRRKFLRLVKIWAFGIATSSDGVSKGDTKDREETCTKTSNTIQDI